jgi:tRNA(Ile)-lysidine synthase
MLQLFQKYIQDQQLIPPHTRLLVAVSGGIDSTVLCELLHQLQYDFAIAHCNFGLRHKESDDEQQWVQQLAETKYGVPFHTIRFDTQQHANMQGISIQMAARELRYQWLEHIRQEYQYAAIATAHHQNDLVETMLYNLTKGTGIAGLHGILPRQGKVIRPLLFTDKESISAFAEQHQIEYRQDSSNNETKYTRNKIRHLVIPTLQEINPNLTQTFYHNALRFAETEIIYQQAIEQYKKKLLTANDQQTYTMPIARLQQLPALRTILYELLKDFGFHNTQLNDIIHALNGESGKIFLSNTHQLLKDRKHLIISPRSTEQAIFYIIEPDTNHIAGTIFELLITQHTTTQYTTPTDRHIAALDYSKLVFPLRLRLWQEGDYFYPLGMNKKKKKVSRFFSDQKLNRNEKKHTWLLEDNEQRIVWIVGHRIDERFKITDKTQTVYQVLVQKNDNSANT